MCPPENSHRSPCRPLGPRPDLKPLPSSLTCCVTVDIWLPFSGPLCVSFLSSGKLKEWTDHSSSSYPG